MMLTFKRTDKDMKCHGGFQYELEKTYMDDVAIRCGDKGFYSYEVPMDVLTNLQPSEGRRFFLAKLTEKSTVAVKIAKLRPASLP